MASESVPEASTGPSLVEPVDEDLDFFSWINYRRSLTNGIPLAIIASFFGTAIIPGAEAAGGVITLVLAVIAVMVRALRIRLTIDRVGVRMANFSGTYRLRADDIDEITEQSQSAGWLGYEAVTFRAGEFACSAHAAAGLNDDEERRLVLSRVRGFANAHDIPSYLTTKGFRFADTREPREKAAAREAIRAHAPERARTASWPNPGRRKTFRSPLASAKRAIFAAGTASFLTSVVLFILARFSGLGENNPEVIEAVRAASIVLGLIAAATAARIALSVDARGVVVVDGLVTTRLTWDEIDQVLVTDPAPSRWTGNTVAFHAGHDITGPIASSCLAPSRRDELLRTVRVHAERHDITCTPTAIAR